MLCKDYCIKMPNSNNRLWQLEYTFSIVVIADCRSDLLFCVRFGYSTCNDKLSLGLTEDDAVCQKQVESCWLQSLDGH